ncbi:hypothetical protein EWH70_21220 [Amycolatopsis suaedae]|uniref:Uncharacterized protein n=1 Tax=Amycolatopsis suaedae TaxID=2510978 RepID=A0A4Q7J5Q4_9PSEU|nr:hypothetical protein EWH70_21220 [Amycolatopsis suaedae]
MLAGALDEVELRRRHVGRLARGARDDQHADVADRAHVGHVVDVGLLGGVLRVLRRRGRLRRLRRLGRLRGLRRFGGLGRLRGLRGLRRLGRRARLRRRRSGRGRRGPLLLRHGRRSDGDADQGTGEHGARDSAQGLLQDDLQKRCRRPVSPTGRIARDFPRPGDSRDHALIARVNSTQNRVTRNTGKSRNENARAAD